jgi:tetratricopeptide (TPR) repeat protein
MQLRRSCGALLSGYLFFSAVALLGQSGTATADDWGECKQGPTPSRVAACTRLIEKGPKNSKTIALAHVYRAGAYRNRGDNTRSIAEITRAMQLDSNLASLGLGLILIAKREYDLAIPALNEAVRKSPKSALAHNALGNAYNLKGDHDRAIEAYTAAIEADPQFAFGFRNRGAAYGAKREHDRAIADLDQAIAISPNFPDGYNSRGVAFESLGQIDRALSDLGKAIALEPTFSRPYNNRGNVYLRRRDYARALPDYNKAIALEPTYGTAYLNRGEVRWRTRDLPKALADFRKVVELPATTGIERQYKELARARIERVTKELQKGAAERSTRRVALVVGNARYAHAGPLANPRNDAQAMAAALRRLGFSTVLERHDVTHKELQQALRDFGDLAEKAEWAVVFFAGHGIEVNGMTYLIPVDAALRRDTHVADETIPLTQIQGKVDAAAKLGLVILDSCRNNPFIAKMTRAAGATRSIGQGLARIEPEGNVLVAYAAKHGTTALDGDGANSPFTKALLASIEEPNLEVNFLFRRVRDDVRMSTKRQQEPFLYGSLGSEPLYFKSAPRSP